MRALAPAKINLALEVLGRRSDGYHDIDTVMTTIDLADRLRAEAATGGRRRRGTLRGRVRARGIDAADDLARRAAIRLAGGGRATSRTSRIEVTKRDSLAGAASAVGRRTRRRCCEG